MSPGEALPSCPPHTPTPPPPLPQASPPTRLLCGHHIPHFHSISFMIVGFFPSFDVASEGHAGRLQRTGTCTRAARAAWRNETPPSADTEAIRQHFDRCGLGHVIAPGGQSEEMREAEMNAEMRREGGRERGNGLTQEARLRKK